MQMHEGGYYIRLSVYDRPGAAAAIATRMAEREISLESIVQRRRPGERGKPAAVPVVLMTHATSEKLIREALAASWRTVSSPNRRSSSASSGSKGMLILRDARFARSSDEGRC